MLLPSRYKVAVWLGPCSGICGLGPTVSTAWCHLPSLTDVLVMQVPKIGALTVTLPTDPTRQPPCAPEAMYRLIGCPPVGPVADDSSVPLAVVLNHTSTDSPPVPAK